MPGEPNVVLRLSIVNPAKGVAYSLQDKNSAPVDVRIGAGQTLLFEISVRLENGKAGPRFLGEHVRTEGNVAAVRLCRDRTAGRTDGYGMEPACEG